MINFLTTQTPFDGSILSYFIAQLCVPSTLSLNKQSINQLNMFSSNTLLHNEEDRKTHLIKCLGRYYKVHLSGCLMPVRVFSALQTKMFNPDTNHSFKATI